MTAKQIHKVLPDNSMPFFLIFCLFSLSCRRSCSLKSESSFSQQETALWQLLSPGAFIHTRKLGRYLEVIPTIVFITTKILRSHINFDLCKKKFWIKVLCNFRNGCFIAFLLIFHVLSRTYALCIQATMPPIELWIESNLWLWHLTLQFQWVLIDLNIPCPPLTTTATTPARP